MAVHVDPQGGAPGAKGFKVVLLTVAVLFLLQGLWFTLVSPRDSLHGSLQPVQGSQYSKGRAGSTTPTGESQPQNNNASWVSEQGERDRVDNATGGEKGPEIVFGVMGEYKRFPIWWEIIQRLNNNTSQVMLVFASFDQPITAGNATLCAEEKTAKQCSFQTRHGLRDGTRLLKPFCVKNAPEVRSSNCGRLLMMMSKI